MFLFLNVLIAKQCHALLVSSIISGLVSSSPLLEALVFLWGWEVLSNISNSFPTAHVIAMLNKSSL